MQVAQIKSDSTDASFSDFLGVFSRQKVLIIMIALVGVLAGLIYCLLVPKLYQSYTQVLLQGRTMTSPYGGSPEDIIPEITMPTATYEVGTQVALLQSGEVFIEALQRANVKIPPVLDTDALAQLPQIRAEQLGNTNLVQVTVNALNKQDAEAVAAIVPQIYTERIQASTSDAVDRALAYVDERTKQENDALDAENQKLADFRTSRNFANSLAESEAMVRRKAELETMISTSRADNAAARAALAMAKESRARLNPRLTRSASTTNTEERKREETVLRQLQVQREQLLSRYLPEHETVKAVDAQIKAQKAAIAALDKKIEVSTDDRNPEIEFHDRRIVELESTVSASSERLNGLEAARQDINSQLGSMLPSIKDEESIRRSISLHEQTLITLARTRDSLVLKQNQLRTPVSTMTNARPAEMIRPNWLATMLATTILGLFLGVVIGFIRDTSQDRVHSADQIRNLTGLNVLARVPMRSRAAAPLISDPGSARAFESYRILRAGILNALHGQNPAVIQLSGLKVGDGASVVAANLAVAMALDGKRVILVDADLRKPTQHKIFNVTATDGLANVLSGNKSMQEVMLSLPTEGITLIPAGESDQQATELLSSAKFNELAAELASHADVVIYDGPAITGAADGLNLANVTKNVVLVSQLNKASRSDLETATESLSRTEARIIGIAVNKLPLGQSDLKR